MSAAGRNTPMQLPRPLRTALRLLAAGIAAALVYTGWQQIPAPLPSQWNSVDASLLQSMSLQMLGAAPADPGNRLADDPTAAEIGRQLFFDSRLSADGTVACASCHQPQRWFTDGLRLGTATAEGDRHTMGLQGVAFSPWHYWDGRKDSLWAQALEPLENPLEHNTNRTDLVRLVASLAEYRGAVAEWLGEEPDFGSLERFPPGASPLGDTEARVAWQGMAVNDRESVNAVFSLIGKALAAFERQLLPAPGPFDRYVASLEASDNRLLTGIGLSRSQVAGLRLFLGKAQCINCHNGPLFSNHDFHNTGLLSAPGQLPGLGRSAGLDQAMGDEFNCLGRYSDAEPAECVELRFARTGDDNLGAMKTPGLRDVERTAPYMHAGQLASLAEVIRHYDLAPDAMLGHNEAEPLRLRAVERRQLEHFLRALNGDP